MAQYIEMTKILWPILVLVLHKNIESEKNSFTIELKSNNHQSNTESNSPISYRLRASNKKLAHSKSQSPQ